MMDHDDVVNGTKYKCLFFIRASGAPTCQHGHCAAWHLHDWPTLAAESQCSCWRQNSSSLFFHCQSRTLRRRS